MQKGVGLQCGTSRCHAHYLTFQGAFLIWLSWYNLFYISFPSLHAPDSLCSEEDDEYSDDDDMSWKVRRAAAKCLGVILGSRPEMLSTFYQDVSPAIIKRFKGQLLFSHNGYHSNIVLCDSMFVSVCLPVSVYCSSMQGHCQSQSFPSP